jgi:hypothetical protein
VSRGFAAEDAPAEAYLNTQLEVQQEEAWPAEQTRFQLVELPSTASGE